jgi:hypothetical protein
MAMNAIRIDPVFRVNTPLQTYCIPTVHTQVGEISTPTQTDTFQCASIEILIGRLIDQKELNTMKILGQFGCVWRGGSG